MLFNQNVNTNELISGKETGKTDCNDRTLKVIVTVKNGKFRM